MEHIAIDLGGRESQICIRSADGKIVKEQRCETKKLGSYLKRRGGKNRIVMETCSEAFAVAEQAREHGHEVRIVPATLVRSLGVGARKTKTDRRDAQVLSEVSTKVDLVGVHIPSALSQERRASCTAREALVKTRTQLINSVRGYLRTRLVRVRSGASSTFPKRVRDALSAQSSGVPEFVERMLTSLEILNAQIDQADRELNTLTSEDTVCLRLRTVPGVGPVTAMRFVAAIDDATRFTSAYAVQAYLGLVPGEHSSGTRERRTGITKAGSSSVRWTLTQAAHCAMLSRTHRNDPMVQWALKIAERRSKPIAVMALARKIAGILFALMRDGRRYEAKRGACPSSDMLSTTVSH